MKIPKLIEENKPLFGTYSAMALMNIETVLNHIQKMAEIEGELPEKPEDYWECPVMVYLNPKVKNISKSPEKTMCIMDKLMECFPFLRIMAEFQRDYSNKKNNEKRVEVNASDLFWVLNNLFRVIKTYRDTTAHYYFKDSRWEDGSSFLSKNEQPISFSVNDYYTVALRYVKDKYNYSTADLAFIQDYRYKDVKELGTRPCKRLDLEFFLSMQAFNGDKTGKLHLSGVGVAQMICLFLEKQYINIFLSKLPIYGKYSPKSAAGQIIRQSMSINSIRLPRERIHSEKNEMSVALDMLNELKRCPKELFEVLSCGEQSRFRIVSSDYNEVLQRRNTDRFAQLTLQYIDYNEMFSNIRFHVNMGKLRYLFSASKKCIDGQERVRVLEHPINAFGRVNEVEKMRKNEDGTFVNTGIKIRDFENVRRDDADAANYPYIVDTYTHYMLENNKIEFCFTGESAMPNIVKDKNGKWYVENRKPDCRMSVLELPAMMFHLHLLGRARTEQRIKTVYDNYRGLFTALHDGTLNKDNIGDYGIAEADIPQKVLDAVNGTGETTSYGEYIKDTVAQLIAETDVLIERLKNDKKTVMSASNKMGKPGYKRISAGKLADFLASDIVKFQQSAFTGSDFGVDKLTGLNYRVMQATIATYSNLSNPDAFEKLKDMFRKAGLTERNGKNSHPFLFAALTRHPLNTVDLYDNYLKARKNYLLKLQERIDEGERVDLPFVNKNKTKWFERDADFYSQLGEDYLDQVPIELPRQMFDDEIKEKLSTLPEMKGVDFEKVNVTYLIGEYIKRFCQDDFQEFYSWRRHYRYIDMLIAEADRKNTLCQQYTTVEQRESLWENREEASKKYRAWALRKKQTDRMSQRISDADFAVMLDRRLATSRNDFQKAEKVIRRYKVQDALMFLLSKDILTENIKFEGKDFKLREILPDTDKGLLSEIMPMNFVFEKNGKTYTIKSKGMKIKNYGDFYSLMHDKRLSSLFNLLSTAEIEKENLEEELDNYDNSRPKVVKLVFDLEKMMFDKYDNMWTIAESYERFGFGKLLSKCVDFGEFSEQESGVLRLIRNAFEHNVYPEEGVVRIKALPEIAENLISVFQQYTQRKD